MTKNVLLDLVVRMNCYAIYKTKEIKATVVLLIVFFCSAVSFGKLYCKTEAKTIVVPDEDGSIQEAVDNAQMATPYS